MPSNGAVARLSPPKLRLRSVCKISETSQVVLQEASSRECGGKAAAGVGRRFSFRFPEPKLEVESCLIPEETRGMGDHEKSPKGPVGSSPHRFTPRTCLWTPRIKNIEVSPQKEGGINPSRDMLGGQSQHHKLEHKLRHPLVNPWHPQWVWMNQRVNINPHPTAGGLAVPLASLGKLQWE